MTWLASLIISGLIISNFGGGSQSFQVEKAGPETAQAAQPLEPGQTGGPEETENFAQNYPFNSNGTVALENVNGSVTIEAWDKNEVRVEYTKTGSDKEIMSMVDVRIDNTKDRIQIEANYDRWKGDNSGDWVKWKGRNLSVNFKLTVPRNAALDQIETVNGSVILSGLTNNCKVSTVNGQVSAKNLRGNANLSTVNGTVDADFDKLEANSRINLSTVNGKVIMVIPSDSSATVKADTVNGSITNDLGLPVHKGEYVGRDMYGKLGNGEAKVKLDSVNGGLSINRRQDGKAPSPATNLLTMKKGDKDHDDDVDVDNDNDDDDQDEDNDNARERERASRAMSRDVERAIRDAVRVIPNIVVDPAVNVEINDEALKEIANTRKEVADAQREASLVDVEALNGQVKAAMKDQERQLKALGKLYSANSYGAMPTVERQGETINVKGTAKITVDAANCAVIVRGWDKQEVEYSLTKFSRAVPQQGQAPGIEVQKDDSKIKIKVSNTTSLPYRLEIFVPRKSDLKISTDKEIRLEGVSGELDLSTPSDAINVRDSDGKLTIASVDGKVRVVGFQGEVNSTTAEGTISLEGDFTRLNADAGDGTIVLTLPADTGAYIAAETTHIFAEGLALTREDDKWKVGKGGGTFNIQSTPDGKVIVRNSNRLRAGN
jgi:DUF4097 and DUF4098 domain-containing protein YvlB